MGYHADLYLASLPTRNNGVYVTATKVQKPAGEIPDRWQQRNFLDPEVHLPVYDRTGERHDMTISIDAPSAYGLRKDPEDRTSSDHAAVTMSSDVLPHWATSDNADNFMLPTFSLPEIEDAIQQLVSATQKPEGMSRYRQNGDRAAALVQQQYSDDTWLFGTLRQRRRFTSDRTRVGMFQTAHTDRRDVLSWPGDPRLADIVFDLQDLRVALAIATTSLDQAEVVYKSEITAGSWI